MEKLILMAFGALYGISGILYIASGQILWGLLTLTLSAVYFFGFERVHGGEKEHQASHISTGGIFASIVAGFLITEKLVSLLSEPEPFTRLDGFFVLISIFAFFAFLWSKKRFV